MFSSDFSSYQEHLKSTQEQLPVGNCFLCSTFSGVLLRYRALSGLNSALVGITKTAIRTSGIVASASLLLISIQRLDQLNEKRT